MTNIHYQTVITAALLHDIGKFLQRGNFGSLSLTGKHPEISKNFVDANSDFFSRFCDIKMLGELVARHHESPSFPSELQAQNAPEEIRKYAYMVSRADNFSSAERDDGEGGGSYISSKKTALLSVFSRLQLDNPVNEAYGYRLERLQPTDAFPVNGREVVDETPYKKHLQNFGAEFKSVANDVNIKSFEQFYNRLLNLLQLYTWCVPSSTLDAVPDVSLYDHLRTTSAITAALYRYHQHIDSNVKNDAEAKFLLVVGDLSGIQKHIFRATVKGYGKIAKRLRARSFYLGLLADVVSHRLLHEFDLPITNIVMASGGKFYVLLPNLTDAAERVKQIQRQIDSELLEKYQGELALNLAAEEFSGKHFSEFGSVMANLSKSLAARKSNAFKEVLQYSCQWQPESFINRLDEYMSVCPGCAKVHGDEGACDDCLQDERLGGNLPRSSHICFFKGQYPSHATPILSDYAITLEDGIKTYNTKPYLVYNINEKGRPFAAPEQIKHLAKHVPVNGHETIGFDDIAAKASGNRLLACLKADVDKLGMLFLLGLQSDDKNHASISRVSTMSRMLELFFSGWIEHQLEEYYPDCYTVYSGGDDLLIIGPWDMVIDMSGHINKEFRAFTANNQNITLSAGISLFKPRYPLDHAIEMAGHLLEMSKEQPNSKTGTSRNQISLFGITMSWSDFARVIFEAKRLAKWVKGGDLPRSVIYRLQEYGALYDKAVYDNDNEGYIYHSLIKYDISRNGRKYSREACEWLEGLGKSDNDLIEFIKPITTYALYSNRGGE